MVAQGLSGQRAGDGKSSAGEHPDKTGHEYTDQEVKLDQTATGTRSTTQRTPNQRSDKERRLWWVYRPFYSW